MALAAFLALQAPPPPPPPPPPTFDVRDKPDAAACRKCHADIAQVHDASRHGIAATNPSFVASLATSSNSADRKWCLDCHAPRVGGDMKAHGVGCLACHVARSHGAGRPKVDDAVCARCHEVGLPPSGLTSEIAKRARAQNTPTEHKEWSSSGATSSRSCVDCHTAGHRWPGGHDGAFAGSTVSVDARVKGAVLLVSISVDGVGHPLPTGDPFRVLSVRACEDRACATELAVTRVGRSLQGAEMKVVDTRPRPGMPPIVLQLAAPTAKFVELSLESIELMTPAEPRTKLTTVAVPTQ